jgi:hypothetical protein
MNALKEVMLRLIYETGEDQQMITAQPFVFFLSCSNALLIRNRLRVMRGDTVEVSPAGPSQQERRTK